MFQTDFDAFNNWIDQVTWPKPHCGRARTKLSSDSEAHDFNHPPLPPGEHQAGTMAGLGAWNLARAALIDHPAAPQK